MVKNYGIFSHALRQFASISLAEFILMTMITMLLTSVIYIFFVKIKGRKINVSDVFAILSLAVYINILLQLTLLGRRDGSRIGVRLNPFEFFGGSSDFSALSLMYAFLNVLLFIPYGFIVAILPVIKKLKNIYVFLVVTLVSFGTSMIIEVIQLMTERGYYEIEDLICNTLGGILGVFFFIIIKGFLTEKGWLEG